jgi:hypothetical protein
VSVKRGGGGASCFDFGDDEEATNGDSDCDWDDEAKEDEKSIVALPSPETAKTREDDDDDAQGGKKACALRCGLTEDADGVGKGT